MYQSFAFTHSSNEDDQIRTDDQSFGSDSEFPPDDPFAENQKNKKAKKTSKKTKKKKEKTMKKKKSKENNKALPPLKGALPPIDSKLPPLTGVLPPLVTADPVEPLIGPSGSTEFLKNSPSSGTTITSSSKSRLFVCSSPGDLVGSGGSPSVETFNGSSEIINLVPEDSPSSPSIETNGNGSARAFSTRNIQRTIMPVPIINVIPAVATQEEDDVTGNPEIANLTPSVNRLPENFNPSLLNVQNSQVFLAPVRSQQASSNMLIQNSERRLPPNSTHSMGRLQQIRSNNSLPLAPTQSQPLDFLDDIPSLDDLNVQPQLIAAQSVAGINQPLQENANDEGNGAGLFASINRALEQEVDALSA